MIKNSRNKEAGAPAAAHKMISCAESPRWHLHQDAKLGRRAGMSMDHGGTKKGKKNQQRLSLGRNQPEIAKNGSNDTEAEAAVE
jgi:hypothetical protein